MVILGEKSVTGNDDDDDKKIKRNSFILEMHPFHLKQNKITNIQKKKKRKAAEE